MNILVTLNSGYIDPLTVMLQSLLFSNPDESFTVYALNSSLTAHDFAYIEARVDRERCRLKNIKIDHARLRGAPITSRYPREMYYRIFAAQYLPETLDRVLYLDPDLVVINPVAELYSMNLDGYYMAAASHVAKSLQKFNELRLKIKNPGPYINSGVMLMNLEILRQRQRLEEVFEYIEANKNLLILPDQDVISGLYADKILAINPYLYNLTERLFFLQPGLDPRVDLDWVRENTVIIHYCGRNKPWKENYRGKLDCFYNEVLARQNSFTCN
jgi:lipopolysaccharide biosynthesis glycosyltransferase